MCDRCSRDVERGLVHQGADRFVSDISSAVATMTCDEPFPLSGSLHPALPPSTNEPELMLIFGAGEGKKLGTIKQHLSAHGFVSLLYKSQQESLLNVMKSCSKKIFRSAGDYWEGQDTTPRRTHSQRGWRPKFLATIYLESGAPS